MSIFSEDSLLMRFLNRVADLMILNLITLLMCLPVITAGASITAMHYVLLKIVRGEEGYIVKPFFHSFKRNLRQATVLWLMFGVLWGLILTSLYMIAQGMMEYPAWLPISLMVTEAILAVVMTYTFAVLARYENTILQTLFNGFALTFGQPLRSLGILIILASPCLLLVRGAVLLPLLVLFGLSVPGLACAMLYDPIFRKLEEQMGVSEKEPEDA